jgi:putative endonuclease
MFWVYVLQSEVTSRFYTGSCEDLDLRLHQHNSALNPSTKHGVPWRLIHSESFSTRPEAVRRERFLKTGKGREELCQLVESQRRSSGRRGDRP